MLKHFIFLLYSNKYHYYIYKKYGNVIKYIMYVFI